MRSRASIKGHPIHPALIPFPFSFLVGAVVVNAAGVFTERPALWTTGAYLALAGLGAALVAAVPGFIDYFLTVPPRSSAKARATKHMLLNLSAVALFALAWAARGNAVLRVRLGEVTDSVVLNVRPLPLAVNVLAVDSFTVLEYREQCAWDCPYLIYTPLLKLREPTGRTFVDVIAVEFSVPTMSTGFCTTGGMHYSSGLVSHVNHIDPYLWANNMIFASLSGTPVPDGQRRHV